MDKREEGFNQLVSKGRSLLRLGNPVDAHSEFERWDGAVSRWLDVNCSNSGISAKWSSLPGSNLVIGNSYYDYPEHWVQYRSAVKERLGWLSKLAPSTFVDSGKADIQAENSFWELIHPEIVRVAESRFKSRHYADSAEAAFKEVNLIIKKFVKDKIGKEIDGAGLMTEAFSVSNPLIELADLTEATGKDIQKGYMQIFAGSMTGIRNPKAHDNINIDEKRAIHFLFLASLLMYKFDERLN